LAPVGAGPDGKHIMMAFTQYGPIELREDQAHERDAYAQRVIDGIARTQPARRDQCISCWARGSGGSVRAPWRNIMRGWR
jgi:phytoene dehydrogenase-like protein